MNNEDDGKDLKPRISFGEKMRAKKLRLPVWFWLFYLLTFIGAFCSKTGVGVFGMMTMLVMPIALFVVWVWIPFSLRKMRKLVLGDIEHPDRVWSEKFSLKRAKRVGMLDEMQAAFDVLRKKREEEQANKEEGARRKSELVLQEQKIVVAGCDWSESRVRTRFDVLEKECNATWWHGGTESAYRSMALVLSSGERILAAISGCMSLESSSDRVLKEIAANTQAIADSSQEIAESTDFIATSMLIGPTKAAFLSALSGGGRGGNGNKRNFITDVTRVFVLVTDKRVLLFYKPDARKGEFAFAEIELGRARVSLKGDDVLLLDAMANKIYKVTSVSKGFAVKFAAVVNATVPNSSTPKVGQSEESSEGPLAQIEKLAAMKDKGILSEEEFQEQKRKFLARM